MGLFKTPKLPEIKPPTPLPDEKELTAARRRRIAKERGSSGSLSTVLSGGGKETLGA